MLRTRRATRLQRSTRSRHSCVGSRRSPCALAVGLLEEAVLAGARDTVDIDDHRHALTFGILLTLGFDDRFVHLLIEFWNNSGAAFDRQVPCAWPVHLEEHQRDAGAVDDRCGQAAVALARPDRELRWTVHVRASAEGNRRAAVISD